MTSAQATLELRGLVTFGLDGRVFGLPISLVREIKAQPDVTEVHRAPDFVRGLVNLRGQLVTVLDPGVRLGLAPRAIGAGSRLVVLKTDAELGPDAGVSLGEEKVGLLVDSIGDVVTPQAEDLEAPPPHLSHAELRLVRSVCKTAASAVGVLDAAALLAAPKASATEAAANEPESRPRGVS